ncbi:MAG: aromatic amino acid ammonia-lyase [Tannerellaceae bacterium]|jgi:histidine ammonia-lyase|nr:aromatic amino acid ammonia-lyase [Tannerellaceae bacterium]
MNVDEAGLRLDFLEKVILEGESLELTACTKQRITACFDFLKAFSSNKIIYGINTGFGPMAQYRIDDESLTQLQYNIIRSHATGAGKPLPDLYVRAAMVARLGTFLQARSGVHVELVELLVEFINRGIYPLIPEHGSVGASGDLVQLAHIALALIGEGEVHHRGEWRPAGEVLQENGLTPFRIYIRDGLSVTNGTSVMTGIGLINVLYAGRLLKWATLASVWMNEIASSYDDLMSDELNRTKRHEGQSRIAAWMRSFAEGSARLQKRENKLYANMSAGEKVFTEKIQAYYSLRCVPQILGPVLDAVENAGKVLVNEVNSACDNPIVDPESRNVYHGGNFHGDYVAFEMDKLKIGITKLTMLMERQLNYLCHDRINGILPPFLNPGVLGLNYGLQASQFTATSTTAENQTLSNPMSVHSIPCNNDNQDMVSMGTNAALLTGTVIENAFQVMAIHFMALAQAVDCLNMEDSLAQQTRNVYRDVRSLFPLFAEDLPKHKEIERIKNYLINAQSLRI